MKKTYTASLFIIALLALLQFDMLQFERLGSQSKTEGLSDNSKPQSLHHSTPKVEAVQSNKKPDSSLSQSHAQSQHADACLKLCQQALDSLQFAFELTDQQQLYLLNNAKLFATQLYNNPHLAANLITQLFDDENPHNQNHHEAIEVIIANLEDEQKAHIAQVLVNTDPSSNGQIALALLTNTVINTELGFEVFQQILDSATDQRIQHKALNLIPRITDQRQKLALLDNLTKVMYSSHHSHTYGAALMAKVAITSDYALVYLDVIDAIEHFDHDSQFHGVKALEMLLKREASDKDKKPTQWASNREVKLALTNIADDTSLPINIRNKARHVVEQYFDSTNQP